MELKELQRAAEQFPASATMPVFFVGHGSPMNALEDNPFTRALSGLGRSVEIPPSAVLVVSAHWLTRGTYVQTSPKPTTIHDFGNFPQELFEVQYPAPGSPDFARQVAQLLPHAVETEEWGLDHGAWTILLHLFPEANIPVFQVSIDYREPMTYHFDLARQLRSLRQKGVLIIGSGNIVHNLRLSIPKLIANEPAPYDWALDFDAWVKQRLEERDFDSLSHYERAGNAGRLSVPTMDHYAPLLYSVALAGENDPITDVYEEVIFGGLSMRTFRIG